MKQLQFTINAGLGDNLLIRIFLDAIKHDYDQIKISHNKNVINEWRNGDPQYYSFLTDLGTLLFSEKPYIFDHENYPTIDMLKIINSLHIVPQKPNIDHLLCKGASLNLNEEYIVITTKIRVISKKDFYPLSIKLWQTLRELSQKYKIVILGEKVVEKSKEYLDHSNTNIVFCIYEQIISNIPNDRVVDLTVPALGITVPNLQKIQQDCLIMKEAKCVITLGIGGNIWLSLAVAKTIGFRFEPNSTVRGIIDFYSIVDLISNPKFTTAFLTKDWNIFLQKLRTL